MAKHALFTQVFESSSQAVERTGRHSQEDQALYLEVGGPEERAEKMKEQRMNEGGRMLIVPVPSVSMSVSQKVVLL